MPPILQAGHIALARCWPRQMVEPRNTGGRRFTAIGQAQRRRAYRMRTPLIARGLGYLTPSRTAHTHPVWLPLSHTGSAATSIGPPYSPRTSLRPRVHSRVARTPSHTVAWMIYASPNTAEPHLPGHRIQTTPIRSCRNPATAQLPPQPGLGRAGTEARVRSPRTCLTRAMGDVCIRPDGAE